MSALSVRGQVDAKPEVPSLQAHLSQAKLTPIYSGRPSADRASAKKHDLDGAKDGDAVELELEDGIKLWMRVEDLRRDFEPVAARDGEKPDAGEIPLYLQPAGPSRGVAGKMAVRAFRVFGIDLAGGAKASAAAAAKRVENKLNLGLHRCGLEGPSDFSKADSLTEAPILLFLHGTASSTDGSFGGLWAGGAAARIRQLATRYGKQVLAFEHRTLTQSPIENALDVVKQLDKALGKKKATLHLVSHSRGGLVGELLCRSTMDDRDPFTAAEIDRFRQAGRDGDAAMLEELNGLLQGGRFQVERFARVACPARGTTLASRRLDRYFSVMLNAVGLIPGLQGNVVLDTVSEVLAAVLKERSNPEAFPGLEAMMPGSLLVALLNDPRYRTNAGLHVLGGDLQGAGIWGRLKELATNLFYLEDHDLVVNTPSMFGGAPRTGTVHYWVDTGPEVNHFNYFRRSDTASRLVEALTGAAPGRFRVQEKAPSEVTEADYGKRALGPLIPRQTVVVLPGIMGTQLQINGNRIWVDPLDLARGGLARLSGDKVETDGLVGDSYKKLVAFLAQSHDVEIYPYDWRKTLPAIVEKPSESGKGKQPGDLFDKAEGLRKRLDAILDRTEPFHQPVRILAHSMGGLVVRAMLATPEGQATWERMKRHPGARFIMLGTPNGGSHAIAALLLGRDALVRKLALLDLTRSHAKLLAIIAGFDGVLQLLPHGGSLDCYRPETWDKLYDHDVPPAKRGIFSSAVATDKSAKIDWAKPGAKLLEEAAKVRDLLRNSPLDAGRMIYVAGKAKQTACDVKVVPENPEGRRVVVLATARGDGRVPWETGIPPQLTASTYYMDATHGDLANSEPDFPALLDLLERGSTTKLPATAPSTRTAADELFELREVPVETYPNRGDLIALAMGGALERGAARPEAPKVRVRVIHGNLSRATSPVMVGHYQGDSIVSAESYLDRRLGGRLSELHRLDLYAGPIETSVVELNEGDGAVSSHPGAIVVGLGQVGDLTPGGLAATVSHGLRRYGAESLTRTPSGDLGEDAPSELNVSTLLVGTGAGGLSVPDALQSILRGVKLANDKLNDPNASNRARIAQVDVVEFYQDRALSAVKSLTTLNLSGEFRDAFDIQETVAQGSDGRARAFFEESPGWWQRIRIRTVEEGVHAGALQFEAVTDRARADTFLQPAQQELVKAFLDRARTVGTNDADLSGTLFELLIPNDFKQYAPDRRNLALILDEDSAKYPWELLHDRFDSTARPMAVEAGMVRVLVTKQGRRAPLPAGEDAALIIGDPPTKYTPLPGAADEARLVRQRLLENRYAVTSLIEREAAPQAVVAALYARKYRIVHIAAHGEYEQPRDGRPAVSGVILGDGVRLTPAVFEQIRFVPDFVFLNCCHLGQMAGAGLQPEKVDHRFAANVATQFIRMGVRAVVAAGWAVDDAPAKVFADELYLQMLAGSEFGAAVGAARRRVFRAYPGSNTWGAYQCYGDPGFRLTKPTDGPRSLPTPCSAAELRIELENIASDASSADDESDDALRERIEHLAKKASPAWLGQADILGAFGEAYGQIGRYEESVDWFERALAAEPAFQRVRTLERLVNFRTRWAENLHAGAAPTPSSGQTATQLIREAEKLSNLLIELGETSERHSIRGSLFKRAAKISSSPAQRAKYLARMEDAYGRAADIARVKQETVDLFYPLQNWYASQILLRWCGGQTAPADKIKLVRQELRASADDQKGKDSVFWDLALEPNVLLLESLDDGQLDEKRLQEVAASFEKAMRRGVARRERNSVRENMRTLAGIAKSGDASGQKAAAALESLSKKLEKSGEAP